MYASEHNNMVKNTLLTHLQSKYSDCQYSPKRLKTAVHRFYESRRRIFNDEQPNRIVVAEKNKVNARKRMFRRKLYNDRLKVARTQTEKEKWETIDFNYMTEESEHETEDGSLVIHRHHLVWRSDKLNRLVNKLDERIPPKKLPGPCKVEQEPSALEAPVGAPDWSVNIASSNLRNLSLIPHMMQFIVITMHALKYYHYVM
jgi:hypothetical protein